MRYGLGRRQDRRDGNLTIGQTRADDAPQPDDYVWDDQWYLYRHKDDAFVEFELDLIEDSVRIEATGDITLKPTNWPGDYFHTIRFRPNGSSPFKAGDNVVMQSVSGGLPGAIVGDFAQPVLAPGEHADVGFGTGGVYTVGWPVSVVDTNDDTVNDAVVVHVEYDLHPGDATLNGITDVQDFNVWNTNKFTSPTEWTTANFNGDSGTDVRDFNIWNSNKFTSVSDPEAASAEGDSEPSTQIELFYNRANGRMKLEVDGDTLTSLILDGPMALSIDRWGNDWLQDGNIWTQGYAGGAEQWWAGLDPDAEPGVFALATAPDGVYHIATFPTNLAESDFGLIEYGTIDGGIYQATVQFLGLKPAQVPEPGTLVLLFIGALLGIAAWRVR